LLPTFKLTCAQQSLIEKQMHDAQALSLASNEWKIHSGLRVLRMNHPDEGEYDRAWSKELSKQRAQLIHDGKLDGLGAYNTRCRQLNGIIRYTTDFPREGGGRSWAGELPEKYKSLPMLDAIIGNPDKLNEVSRFVEKAAAEMPSNVHDPVTDLLTEVERARQPTMTLRDLWPHTAQTNSPYQAKINAIVASGIVDVFDYIVMPTGSPNFERASDLSKVLAKAYSGYRISGLVQAATLLIMETIIAASPRWPFFYKVPNVVCGRFPCNHKVCEHHLTKFHGVQWPIKSLDDLPDKPIRYILEHVADPVALIGEIGRSASNHEFAVRASSRLFEAGQQTLSQLAVKRTVKDFYQLHFDALPYFRGAMLGYRVLSVVAPAHLHAELEQAAVRADEFQARTVAALWCDFGNANDYGCVDRIRATYKHLSDASTIRASLYLQKILFDERQFPEFWIDYLTGKTDGLPIILET
jgi:hypothetical protein